MLISHRYKFVIINIPKTGTWSFVEVLRPYVDVWGAPAGFGEYADHETASNAKRKFEQQNLDWQSYFTFARVRNPWQRYASYFQWAKDFLIDYRVNPQLYRQHGNTYQSFATLFADNSDFEVLRTIIKNNEAQSAYFLGPQQETLVNYVGQLENIDTDFQLFCRTVGLPQLQLPKRHVSTDYDYRQLYTSDLVKLVAAKEKYVIERFNYTFN